MADQDAFGAKLWAKRKSETNYGELADVIDGDFAKLKKIITDRKSLGQGNRYIKRRGTFIDPGALPFKLSFSKPKFVTLKAFLEDPNAWDVRIEVPDDELGTTEAPKVSRFAADGLLEELGQPLPADGGRLESDILIALSGATTFTESTTPTVAA
jgi:hypothetical protein